MASNGHVFGSEFPHVHHPRKQSKKVEKWNPNETTRKRKQPRIRSSHRSQRSGRPKDRSAFFQKPKLYSQPSYIGPTDVEPFSSFKCSNVPDSDQEGEGFSNAICRELACWQTELHSHDLPKRLETGCRGNVPQVQKLDITNVAKVSNNELNNRLLVCRTPLRPPSLLVAGPACLSDRIVEPSSARSHNRLGREPTIPPSNSPLESHCPLSGSSILQTALGGTRELRNALPPSSNDHETSYPRGIQPSAWRVSLPIHTRPSVKRKLESEGPRDSNFAASSSRSLDEPADYNSKEEHQTDPPPGRKRRESYEKRRIR